MANYRYTEYMKKIMKKLGPLALHLAALTLIAVGVTKLQLTAYITALIGGGYALAAMALGGIK